MSASAGSLPTFRKPRAVRVSKNNATLTPFAWGLTSDTERTQSLADLRELHSSKRATSPPVSRNRVMSSQACFEFMMKV